MAQQKAKAGSGKLQIMAKNKYRLDLLYFFIIMIVVIIVYNKVYDKKLYLGGDNAVYFITAKAIADGQGYTNINSPANQPATWYPPGYPFISAMVMKVFGEKIEVMNKANGFFLFGSLIFLYLISLRFTKNKHLSFVITIITALNVHLLSYSFIAMSEIPFVFTSLGALAFFMRWKKEGLPFKDYNFWVFLVFLILSYYIREFGIVLIGASLLFLLLERKWKLAIIVFAAFILCAFPWYVRNKLVTGSRYESQLVMKNPYKPELGNMRAADWFARIENNAVRYASLEIPSAMLGYSIDNTNTYNNTTPKDRNWFIGILFVLLVVAGLLRVREHKWLLIFYLAGTFAVLMLWPDVWVGIRFILIIIPLIYMLAILTVYDGLLWLSGKINLQGKTRVSVIPFLFLAYIFVLQDGIGFLSKNAKGYYPAPYYQYFELAKWVKLNLPASSVVVCRKPELFYLYANCKTVNFLNTLNADSLISNLKAEGATHVVIDHLGFSSTVHYLLPAIKKDYEKFKLIKQTADPENFLYEIHYECGYTGEMQNGKKNGKGVSRYAEGQIYDGYWKDDKKDGKGVFTWPNGMKFDGYFTNDLRNGEGIQYYENGNMLKGTWTHDTLNGYAKLMDPKGKIIKEGITKNDKFVDSK